MPEAPGAAVQVQLSVRRGNEAIAFYRKAFGAVELFRFESDGEVVAQLAIGETMLWIEDESPEHDNFSPETLGGATERLLLVVDDPASVVDQALACGARRIQSVEEHHDWLLGRVVDPYGHHWEIGRPRGAWPPTAGKERP